MGGKFSSSGEALNPKTAQFFIPLPTHAKCKMLMKQSRYRKNKKNQLYDERLTRSLACRIKITELGELDPSLKDTRADCPRNRVGRDLRNFRRSLRCVEYSNVHVYVWHRRQRRTDVFCWMC